MNVLVACESSGRVREAFKRRGHFAVSCDILPSEIPGLHWMGDVSEILDLGWDFMIAHPTCTRLANSGVRWLDKPPPGKTKEQMWEALAAGAAFYRKLRNAKIPKKVLENPVMHRYALELIQPGPRQVVQPWWFGEPFFKATGFELIGGVPPLRATNKLVPPKKGTPEHKAWSAVHRASPGPDRWKDRSRTYLGVAEAMAEQWGSL